MGRNSRQRRDARRRAARPAAAGHFPFGAQDVDASAEHVERLVVRELGRLAAGRLPADLTETATTLVRRATPLPASAVRRVVDDVVGRVVASRVASGWCPDDLDQLLGRAGNATDHAVLGDWLRDDCRHADPAGPWSAQVERFPRGRPLPSDDATGVAPIAAALHLGALLQAQPGLPETLTRTSTWPDRPYATDVPAGPPSDPAGDEAMARKLATVRGLLAKAESTTFDEEAEALSAKAQELISRYALERLVEQAATGGSPSVARARRVWLEAPYVGAKAQLVHEVARANTCRAVLSDPPGACTVVGDPTDLDAVELLVTSLLVQAGRAMLRHGRAVDARGTTRTRSFRQSFLMAFAIRIGERLTRTAEQVVHDSGHSDDLLPVLRSRQVAVEEAFAALVPSTVTKRRTISSSAGWHAGQAAADLASLDVRRPIGEGGGRAG